MSFQLLYRGDVSFHTDWMVLVGDIHMHAMRRSSPKIRHTCIEGQVSKYG